MDLEQAAEALLMSLYVNLVTIPLLVISIISTIFFTSFRNLILLLSYSK
jgi:hypothetical protein